MAAPIYQLGLFGSPTVAEKGEIHDLVTAATRPLGMAIGNEISIVANPGDLLINTGRTSAAAFL